MSYRVLDLENDPRKGHFSYFHNFANPYVGVTMDVDITDFMAARERAGLPFFLPFLYCAGRAANRVPQLRQRILNDSAVEFDRCDTSHTVLLDDGSYCYCRLDCMQPFRNFLPEAEAKQEQAKLAPSIDDGDEGLSLLFVSSLPWLHYRSFTQPTPVPADSNPRITWGKYEAQNGRITIPVTLLANHALVDGLHLAAFYKALDEELQALTESI